MKTETIADIVADLRARNQGCPLDAEGSHCTVEDILFLADRIESAHESEVVAAATRAATCAIKYTEERVMREVAERETVDIDSRAIYGEVRESVTECNGLNTVKAYEVVAKWRDHLEFKFANGFGIDSAADIGRDMLACLDEIEQFISVPSEPIGNNAKMREALLRIHTILKEYLRHEILSESMCLRIKNEINAALAESATTTSDNAVKMRHLLAQARTLLKVCTWDEDIDMTALNSLLAEIDEVLAQEKKGGNDGK